jgi:hypothetical protein
MKLDGKRFVCVDGSHTMSGCRADVIRNNRKAAKLPTGLVSNWQLKVLPKQGQMSSKVNANATVKNTSTLGGLEDEDTSSEILATLAVSEGPSQTNDVHCFHSPNKHANII